jgi:heme O synthase-like polyprenyltransferase
MDSSYIVVFLGTLLIIWFFYVAVKHYRSEKGKYKFFRAILTILFVIIILLAIAWIFPDLPGDPGIPFP